MRMLFAISATAAALIAAPATAGDPAETRFKHEGYTYAYTAEDSGERKIITGRRYPGNTPFRLVVNGDRVRGVTGGTPVSFKLSEVERIGSVERLAAR